jgi:hypothetical protein
VNQMKEKGEEESGMKKGNCMFNKINPMSR